MSISQRFYEAIKIKLLAKKNHIPNIGQSTLGACLGTYNNMF